MGTPYMLMWETGVARYTGLGPLITAIQQFHPGCYHGQQQCCSNWPLSCRVGCLGFWSLQSWPESAMSLNVVKPCGGKARRENKAKLVNTKEEEN